MGNENTARDILNRREAAEYLGICVTTLDRLDIPRSRMRHRVAYRREELKKWFENQTEQKRRK
jgi:predicted DNA-binding transcriptional regulator AlpA